MVLGYSSTMNQFDSLSVEVDIDLQHNSEYIGGVSGWSWLFSNVENSIVNGSIDGGFHKIGGFHGGAKFLLKIVLVR